MNSTATTPTVHEFISTSAPDRVFYVCGTCWNVSRECQDRKPCPFCTCHICHEQPRERSGWPCADCRARLDSERDAREQEALLACQVVDDDGSPVYVPALDSYFNDAHEAAEAVWDEAADATIAVPCDKKRVATPDLVEVVEEAWNEGSADEDPHEIEPAVRGFLIAAQAVVACGAPTVWIPRAGVRIALPSYDEEGV